MKILRRASQNNCLNIMYTVITQLAQDSTGRSAEGPLKVLTSRTYRYLQGTLGGPILKFMVYDLLIKSYFRSNSLCITNLFLSFTGKKIFKYSKWVHPRDVYLRVPVAGRLGDQIIGHSRDVHRTLVKMHFKFNSQTN